MLLPRVGNVSSTALHQASIDLQNQATRAISHNPEMPEVVDLSLIRLISFLALRLVEAFW
jgi:hypothetical protein